MDGILIPFLENMPYVGLVLVLMACGLGLPLPEDIPLILSGWLVHRGLADSLAVMMVVGIFGVLAGDSIIFGLGWRYGESIVEHRFTRRLISPERLRWAESWFQKRGARLIFLGRFMPGARAVLFVTAGIFRISYLKFVLIDGFAALISVPLWIWAGWRFGREAERLAGGNAKWMVFGVIALVLAGWIVWEVHQHRKLRRRSMEVAPLEFPPAAQPADPASKDQAAESLGRPAGAGRKH